MEMEEVVEVQYMVRPKESGRPYNGMPMKNNLSWGTIYSCMRTAHIAADGFCKAHLQVSIGEWSTGETPHTFQILSVGRVMRGAREVLSFEQFLQLAKTDADRRLRTHNRSAPH